MPRWSKKDTDAIAIVRSKCAEELKGVEAFPEVVGDRRILRFIKGHPESIELASEMFAKFLKWRKETGVDAWRNDIVTGGADHPTKFPGADVIGKLIPSIQCTLGTCTDKLGSPLCVDQYDFNPNDILEKIELDDYIKYAVYGLEYKMMILDQRSHEMEKKFLADLSEEDREKALEPYGEHFEGWGYQFTLYTCVIRDLGGVGWGHLGEKGRQIMSAVIGLASDNYPELLRKCIMINTPWLFSTVWTLVKGWLAAKTVEKISMVGTDFKGAVMEEVEEHNIPEMVGGPYKGGISYEKFDFDVEWLTTPFEPDVLCDEQSVPQAVGHRKSSGDGLTTSESDSSPPPAPLTGADSAAPPAAP